MTKTVILLFLILLVAFAAYLIYRVNRVFKKQEELAKFVSDRSRDDEGDFESYRTRLRWFNRDCGFDYMTYTFWVWPLDKLVRGIYRDDFLEWKRYQPYRKGF